MAKTGTRTIIKILENLSIKLGYIAETPSFKEETVQGDTNDVMQEIGEIVKSNRNSIIRSRHFSFIDFEKYGFSWTPHWFSMVREPVERVKIFLNYDLR